MSQTATAENQSHAGKSSGIGLLVAAVGVVYGDIGTSPLYTLKAVSYTHLTLPTILLV